MKSPITPKLFKFLRELTTNNDRDWFNANKPRFQAEVQEPALELIDRLAVPLARSAPMLRCVAKKSGGSLMRIYRDTRFSKDKSPYKTNVGISLRHDAEHDIHAPGVYIHLAADECFVGAGCWRPERNTLAAIRASIDESPKAWVKVRDNKPMRKRYQLSGESLKTSPRDYPKDHPRIEDLRRIDFLLVAPLTQKQLCADDCVKTLVDHIKAAKPMMQWLCDAIEVPY